MRKVLFTLAVVAFFAINAQAQTVFAQDIEAPEGFDSEVLVMPKSPLTTQILFIGNTDMVQTTATYGNPAGETPAKQWHDFIGFTPDPDSDDLGWVSVNHEMIQANDMIGDGGGMTVFKVRRDAETDTLIVLEQTIVDDHMPGSPTRTGKYFNVDFVNTVGETGMNCGGISSIVDGRIWTAEEWFRSSNTSINDNRGSVGVRDTADFVIDAPEFPAFDGKVVPKYQNFNYMVEIDPRKARAIRKQYNWGRQPFEGGVVSPNNKRVYLGPDATPGFFGMFIADTPGDFTEGTLYAYKHDKPGYKWVPLFTFDEETKADYFINIQDEIVKRGATMYNRIEWVAIDPVTGDVYWTETGRDNPGSRWAGEFEEGAVFDPWTLEYAAQLGVDSPTSPDYVDYFGRVWKYDVALDTNVVYIEGGAGITTNKHMSNPDGLNIMTINGRSYMVICEDLNGSSQGRVPEGTQSRTCELWLLDMAIENPDVDDLLRIGVVPAGAEVTGAMPTPDGKSLLVNVQHPSTDNPFPFNNSLTYAIHGFDKLTEASLTEPTVESRAEEAAFTVFPNPTARTVYFNEVTDVAVYNAEGKRILVQRNVNSLDVSALDAGVYFIQNAAGETITLSIQ